MAQLVVGGICRYAINQSMAGRPIVNIVDMHVDVDTSVMGRSNGLVIVAGDLINNWVDHILPLQVNNLSLDSVSWVDLNDEDGSVGERTVTSEHTLPLTGGGTQDAAPGMVAMRARKVGGASRLRRAGRMYIGGIAENWTADGTPNTFSPDVVAGMQGALGDWYDGIEDWNPLVNQVSRRPVVVHRPQVGDPSYSVISGYIVESGVYRIARRTVGRV